MNAFLRLFLKLFIVETVAFGFILSLIPMIFGFPVAESLILGFLVGLVISLVLSFFLSLLHVRSVKAFGPDNYSNALGVHHERKILLPVSRNEALDMCYHSRHTFNDHEDRDEQDDDKISVKMKLLGRKGIS